MTTREELTDGVIIQRRNGLVKLWRVPEEKEAGPKKYGVAKKEKARRELQATFDQRRWELLRERQTTVEELLALANNPPSRSVPHWNLTRKIGELFECGGVRGIHPLLEDPSRCLRDAEDMQPSILWMKGWKEWKG
jgi:hypothetical protein